MSTLTELLLACSVPTQRAAAEAQLKAAEQASVEQYFVALAEELAGQNKPVIARQLSGLLLKNCLASKDPNRSRELKARWEAVPAPSRNRIKECTANALLAPELDIGKAAAQVLAKIGSIEVPSGEWQGLVPLLLTHVTNTDPRARQISLITLGYLCDDLVMLQEEGITINDEISNNILTAVCQGMRDGDLTTKLEATRAFYYAVVLAQKNFRNDRERSFIMETVIAACKTPGAEVVSIAALECLAQIATEYYDFLGPHMDALGTLTLQTIKDAPEKVAIPAMEFWSTVCDEELYLKDLVMDGQAGSRKPLNIIGQALPFLVPLLTETLTKGKTEDEDDDTWNLGMAAGMCLQLVAQVVGDACVDKVLEFVQANFANPDWKYREAAVLAYGSIMEGPSSEKMRPLVQNSYSHLVQRLADPSIAVRDTVSWTVGRIVRFHPSIVPIRELTPVLGEKLSDVPRVSANICWVIQELAEAQPSCLGPQATESTALSEFFPQLAQALLQVTTRPDSDERSLRMSAYNALGILCSRSGNDCFGHMASLTQEMIGRLQMTFKGSNDERTHELQGLICGVLQHLVQRLRDRVLPAAQLIFEEATKVMQAYQAQADGTIRNALHEEALLLVIALANAIGPHFEQLMPRFAVFLRVGLTNHEDVQTCLMTVGSICDLCRSLEGKMVVYCDDIVNILYTHLRTPTVNRKIKAAIMSSFGDIAMAIGGSFEKYLKHVIEMMLEASRTRLQDGPANNEDWIEYLNSLRESVLEGYSGIIHGLKEAGKVHLFKEHVNAALHLVQTVTEDPTTTEAVMKMAVGVIGDLISVFQQELAQHLGQATFLVKLVEFANRCPDNNMRQTAQWLTCLLQKYGAR